MHEIPKSKPEKITIEELKSTLQSIREGTEVSLISQLKINPSRVEEDPVFQETIIGSQDSSVSQLIKKLQNSDWVQEGLKYLPKDIKEAVECPFCQEKTITEKLANDIRRYFDESYKKKIDQVSKCQNEYESIIKIVSKFQEQNKENQFITDKNEQFKSIVFQLKTVLEKNLEKIKRKSKIQVKKFH